MPANPLAPLPDLAALVAHYRDLLGLRDWDIRAEWAEPGDMPEGALACVVPLPTRRLATVRVSTQCPPEELRASVAHELIHALLSPLTAVAEPSAGAVMLEEQAVEALALAVVRAEGDDLRALSRAFERLPSRLRARLYAREIPAPKVGALRGRMDIEALKKAIAAIKEGNGDAALAVLEAMIVAEAGHAEPDGDEAAPLAEEAPPPADEAKAEVDPEAEEPKAKDGEPDGNEEYRKRLEALGAHVLRELGEKDPVRAKGRVSARLETAKTATGAIVDASEIKRRAAWDKAIRDGVFTAGKVWKRVEGADGKPVKAYSDFAASVNKRHAEVEELEGYLSDLPRIAAREEHAADGAKASEVDAALPRQAPIANITDAAARRAARMGVDAKELAAAVAAQTRRIAAEEV